MIREGEPDPRSVALLEGPGARSVVFDPFGNAGDSVTVMGRNLETLQSAFTDE